MSKFIEILRSSDYESKQRQVARMKKEIAYLTEEVQLIELSLESPRPLRKPTN